MQASASVTGAVNRIVQRQNQRILDGQVGAVLEDGTLVVRCQTTILTVGALIDHVFKPSEAVRLARCDDGTYVVIGLGGAGAISQGPGVVTAVPIGAISQSLAAAIGRLVERQNRILLRGTVQTVFEDGTLHVRLRGGLHLARAATTQIFAAGQRIYAMRMDSGAILVLGGGRR